MPAFPVPVHVVVVHPWRDTPKGELSLLLDPEEPGLHLARLPEEELLESGEVLEAVDEQALLTEVSLHTSPDERVPEVAQRVAELLFEHMPTWLEDRLTELLNGIHGFGTSRNPRGPAGKAGMDHPLAPIGVWGPAVEKVQGAVRERKFSSWDDVEARLDPVVVASIEDDAPEALARDVLGVSEPKVLLKEPM